MANQKPDLSICIVSYNALEYLQKCLISIFASQEQITFEVIVVDNNSEEGNASFIEQNYPQVRLIKNLENTFFASASNQAMKIAQATLFLLLNPDTEIISGSLTKLVTYINEHEKVGVLGPKLLNSDHSLQYSIGNYLNLGNFLNEYTHFYKLNFKLREKKYQEEHARIHPVESLLGACLLVRREVVEKIGSLDEYFHFYAEEVDFNFRANQAGYQVLYYPDVSVYHHSGKSANQNLHRRVLSLEENLKSQYRFIRKHRSRIEQIFTKIFLTKVLILRLLVRSLLSIRDERDKKLLSQEKIASFQRTVKWLWKEANSEKWDNFEHYQ